MWFISFCFFFFSSRRRHTRYWRDWSSDVCSSDLAETEGAVVRLFVNRARPELRRLLDRRQLAADAFAGALVVTVQVETDEDEQAAQLAAQPLTSLADEWDRYLASVPIEGYDRDRLADMGRAYLQQVEEEAR